MELKDWIAIVALIMGLGNTGWQIWVHRNKVKRENEQDHREVERDISKKKEMLEAKYLQIFRDHLGLATWRAKAFEAQDAGFSPEEVVSLLERVWVPVQKNPAGTQEEILNPMMNELRSRKLKGYVNCVT